MIFQKRIFTRVRLPHCKHILLFTCHQTINSRLFWKLGINSTMESFKYSNIRQHNVFNWILPSRTQTKINCHVQVFTFFVCLCLGFFPHFMKVIFRGSDTRPIQVGTWILDLSHDPIWAIWLAEVNKFHQLCDRINHLTLSGSKQTQWWLAQTQHWLVDSN